MVCVLVAGQKLFFLSLLSLTGVKCVWKGIFLRKINHFVENRLKYKFWPENLLFAYGWDWFIFLSGGCSCMHVRFTELNKLELCKGKFDHFISATLLMLIARGTSFHAHATYINIYGFPTLWIIWVFVYTNTLCIFPQLTYCGHFSL